MVLGIANQSIASQSRNSEYNYTIKKRIPQGSVSRYTHEHSGCVLGVVQAGQNKVISALIELCAKTMCNRVPSPSLGTEAHYVHFCHSSDSIAQITCTHYLFQQNCAPQYFILASRARRLVKYNRTSFEHASQIILYVCMKHAMHVPSASTMSHAVSRSTRTCCITPICLTNACIRVHHTQALRSSQGVPTTVLLFTHTTSVLCVDRRRQRCIYHTSRCHRIRVTAQMMY